MGSVPIFDLRSGVAKICGWLAAVSLAAMMLVTVADVILRAAIDRPIRGTLEIVEFLLTCTFFLALPASFLREEHIVVDVVDSYFASWVPLLKRVAGVLAVLVLAAMAWQGWIAARDALLFHDVTSDLAIPRIWYWVPVLAGMIGGGIAAAAMLLRGKSAE